MTATPGGIVLWLVVVWPLLLSIPALHTRLPWPRQLAVLPVLILFVLPVTTTLKLPWVLFGTGLALSADQRWLLAMFIVIWLITAARVKASTQGASSSRVTTFFLLTLAGNLGALLAADLVGFFVFATLMGYSFYGLMLPQTDAAARNAARCYVIALVVGDLALFEALLLAAAASDTLQYRAVQQVMAVSPSLPLYLGMVLAGFIVKAGVWPAHIWITAAMRTVSPLSRVLLAAVPVIMALLGAVRWLPVGTATATVAGYVLQVLGALTLVSASVSLFRTKIILATWCMFVLTGLFIFLLGHGLVQPSTWRDYAPFVHPGLAIMGVVISLLVVQSLQRKRAQGSGIPPAQAVQCLPGRLVYWLSVFRRAAGRIQMAVQTQVGAILRKDLRQAVIACGEHKPAIRGGRWLIVVTCFVLLILLFAVLAG